MMWVFKSGYSVAIIRHRNKNRMPGSTSVTKDSKKIIPKGKPSEGLIETSQTSKNNAIRGSSTLCGHSDPTYSKNSSNALMYMSDNMPDARKLSRSRFPPDPK